VAAVAPRISVVIPTRRRRDPLARTLAALERQTLEPAQFEVVVVGDPSDDLAEVEAVVDAPRRRMATQVITGVTDNASASRNAGWRRASGTLIVFIGDDILTGPDFLALHLARHERDGDPSTGVLGLVRWAKELQVTTFMRWLDRGVQFDFGALEGRDAADWWHLYTANVSIPRAALERVGGFDAERYPFLYEDLDLGRRLNDAGGFRLLYEPRAVGDHLHAPTLEEYRGRIAAVAAAERRWVADDPEHVAYFHDKFASAARQPPARGRGRLLARWVRPGTPLLGRRTWDSVDVFYRQQLAPEFLAAWDENGR
jgi:GT2 family glycosyltransferase